MVGWVGWLDGVGEEHVDFQEEHGHVVESSVSDVLGAVDECDAVGVERKVEDEPHALLIRQLSHYET